MSGITPLTYQILLALADGDGHGYGIIKEIEQRSGSASAPSTGALYLALQRMEGEGLIQEAPARPGDDARRRYYRLGVPSRSRYTWPCSWPRLETRSSSLAVPRDPMAGRSAARTRSRRVPAPSRKGVVRRGL